MIHPLLLSIRSSQRNVSSNSNSSSTSSTSSTSFYSPKECPICLETYKENDEICWSHNEQCCHAYHSDCMVNWLMEHDDCPLCRNDYLMIGEA